MTIKMTIKFIKCPKCKRKPKFWTIPLRIDKKWKTTTGICSGCNKETKLGISH